MAESLILIEHDRQQVKRPSLNAIALARQLGGDYELLVLGHSLDGIATSLVSYGASAVLVADDPAFAEPLADRYAALIAEERERAARRPSWEPPQRLAKTFCRGLLRCLMRQWLPTWLRSKRRMARSLTDVPSTPAACSPRSR